MIQRSYRNMLLALHNGFCKDVNNSGKNKKRHQKAYNYTKNQSQDQKKDKSLKSEKAQRPPEVKGQSVFEVDSKDGQPYQKGTFNIGKNSERIDKKSSPSFPKLQRFEWEKNPPNQAKIQHQRQLENIRKGFNSSVEHNLFQQQLLKDFENINVQGHLQAGGNKIQVYLNQDFHTGKQFVIKNIQKLKPTSEHAKQQVCEIVEKMLMKYIQQEDAEGLSNFIHKISDLIQRKELSITFKEAKVLSYIELVSELAQSSKKYKTLSNLIRLSQFESVRKQKASLVIRSVIQKFLSHFKASDFDTRNLQLCSSFEGLLKDIVSKKLIPEKYIRSNSMFQLIDKLYFHKCSVGQGYEKFFNLLKSAKATITNEDDFLLEFYQKFSAAIQKGQLKSTDCEQIPLLVNEQLLKNYHKFIENTNRDKESVVAILAICLANRYLSVPQHFIEQASKTTKAWIPHSLMASIKQDYKLAKISQCMKNNQKNAEGIKSLTIQLEQTARPFSNLKTAIITKNYEKAMRIFTDEFFKKLCLRKQSQVIKTVLRKFYLTQANSSVNEKQLNQRIDRFIGTLDDEYLWESWKKSQDLGYLLEDYYIKEGEQAEQKAEKRFSFWQSYFETKRARQVNKMQKLNQLAELKEPNQQPLLEGEFNLSKYLEPESYERYRAVADYNDKKEVELEQYLKKVELILLDLKLDSQETDKSRVLSYQAELCEENLAILEHFGIKDYDIQLYEVEELQNRIANYRKYRGVPRLNSFYDRFYTNQNAFDVLGAQDENYQNFKRKLTMTQVVETAAETKLEEEGQASLEQESAKNADQKEKVVMEAAKKMLEDEGQPVSQVKAEESQEKKKKQKLNSRQVKEEENNNQAVEALETEQFGTEVESQEGKVTSEGVGKHISNIDPTKLETQQPLGLKEPTKELVDILRVKRRDLFADEAANRKLRPSATVEQLIRWGVLNKEPMGIYMGEKLAMLTGQTIPHQLAIRVSDLLAYHREIDPNLFKECKICLTYIGRIERELIYNGNYHYHHIHYRPRLANSIVNFNSQLRGRLEDYVMAKPNAIQANVQPRQAYRKLAKGSLF